MWNDGEDSIHSNEASPDNSKGASVKLGDMAQIIVPEGMNNLYEMVVLSNTSEVEKNLLSSMS